MSNDISNNDHNSDSMAVLSTETGIHTLMPPTNDSNHDHVVIVEAVMCAYTQGGNVWEKAGVNVSVVYGSMPPEAYRAATGTSKQLGKENGAQDRVPFFACGISSVMHPHNPFAPTMHFNYRSVCCAWCSHCRQESMI